jgi:hypothetical protein
MAASFGGGGMASEGIAGSAGIAWFSSTIVSDRSRS